MRLFFIGFLICAGMAFADAVNIDDVEFTPRSGNVHALEGSDYVIGFSYHKSIKKCKIFPPWLPQPLTLDVFNSTISSSEDVIAATDNGKNNLFSYGGQGMCKIHVTDADQSGSGVWYIIAVDPSVTLQLHKILRVIVHPKNSLEITPTTTHLSIEEGEDFRIGYLEHPAISKCYYQMDNGEGDSFYLNYDTQTNQQTRGKTDFIFTHELSGLCQIYVTYPKNNAILRFTITASNGRQNISATDFTISYYKKDSIPDERQGPSLPTNRTVVEVEQKKSFNLTCSSGGEPLSDCLFTSPFDKTYHLLRNENANNFSYGTTWHKGECSIQVEHISVFDYGLWTCEYKIGFGDTRETSTTEFLVKELEPSSEYSDGIKATDNYGFFSSINDITRIVIAIKLLVIGIIMGVAVITYRKRKQKKSILPPENHWNGTLQFEP